ncbi:MAG TPA: hypothetical protein VH724_06970 [Candidatus Angelobacter sp.]|jgi:hypothetical protein|nr:hypothetical protein [Candidatus Angelobacter sp.]
MNPATIDYAIKMFCCVFAAGTLVYVFLPTRDTETGVTKTRVVYLYERKDVVYENLRDLNFEFKSGKFTQADYDGMRIGLEAEAARIMAEIEMLESVKA